MRTCECGKPHYAKGKCRKCYLKEYDSDPERKARKKARHIEYYHNTPGKREERLQYMKEYHQRPETKQRIREYSKRPEVRQKKKNIQKKAYIRKLNKGLPKYLPEYIIRILENGKAVP